MELRANALWMSGIGPEEKDQEFAIILERAAAGDVSAFEQIILRYERRVLSVAWRLLGKAEDAQDASQEVFLRAFRYLHRFDQRRPFEPWLIKMTINVCYDLGKKRREFPNAGIDPDILQISRDPHDELHSSERKAMLYNALQELPEKERAALVLRDLEGLSTAEVAEILGSSESTVRSQISSARLKVRKFVKQGRL
jgi:RNA polymerase sigma-70 factor (ECF subfamily)